MQKIKVLVLLSTYNGEHFIYKQISSILTQINVEVKLVIRDDGSTDKTVSVLREFQNGKRDVELITARNVGFVESFTELVKYAAEKYSDYEYFAFADQDDLWYPNKLYVASTILDKFSRNEPNVYCCNSDLIDDNDIVIGKFKKNKPRYTRGNVIFYGTFQGCSMVFNKAALIEYYNHPPISAYHDRWMYLVCHFLGNTYYDDRSLFGYRIHESNVIGTKVKEDNFMQDIKKFHRKKNNTNRTVIEEFLCCWGNRIKPKDLANINVYYSYHDSYKLKWKLLFSSSFGPKDLSYRGVIGHLFRVLRNEL